jgi:release factor glutamine methyltransferase
VDVVFKKHDVSQQNSEAFTTSFDVIVSNPPYILPAEKETLEPQVKNYEPHQALFCDALEAMYQYIIDHAANHLKKKGKLYLEINAAFPNVILSLFDDKQWHCSLLRDYNKKPRFIIARKLI